MWVVQWANAKRGLKVLHVHVSLLLWVDSKVDIIIRAFAGQNALTVLRH